MIPAWLEQDYQQLVKLAYNEQLHHGLLLQASPGVGSLELATQLTTDILCLAQKGYACGSCKSCQLVVSQTHPDMMLISPEKDSISVEQVRAMSQFFNSTASYQGAKVVIVDAAHTLTLAASNALLKTLEEPNSGRYILLLADLSPQLPATILSRCLKLKLTVDSQLAGNFLAGLGIDSNTPWLKPFIKQPLRIQKWHEQAQLSQLEALFNIAHSNDLTSKQKQLLEFFNQNHDYIAIFTQFLMYKLKTDLLNNALNITQYESYSQAILSFSSKLNEVKGVNLSLQLAVLLEKLSQL